MFKLESYITPLLLGYVDKYIKNLKPEDFQLSLWGGDAVFTNLDIRLDVLEDEFNLPFTFTNGHIHELRIHVPWTKLASESIVITIETIECVIALKDFSKSNGDQAGKTPRQDAKRRSRRTELQEAPPGYVQSFITRILSNICINCNNLILKYVEDDIVFSLNIKSAEMYNANHGWERAFIDISAQNPVLRQIIHMNDLTVCLDKRNASGIVEMYQDPLLFRCSAVCRLYTAYDNPHSKIAKSSRISVYCDHLDFSVTDQQLRMLSRLLELCLALYSGELSQKTKHSRSDVKEEGSESFESSLNENQIGWGSWALSMVPQIIPLWDEGSEDQDDFQANQRQRASQTFQFRFLIDKTSCVFKVTESAKPTKLLFRSIALARLYGTSVELTLRGLNVVNCQLGVIGAEISSLDGCICGGESISEVDKVHFQAGVMPGGGHTYSFITSSLFDPLASENSEGNRQEHDFDWESHLNCLTENVMLERYPAFGVDYIYEVEIPQDWSDKLSELTSTFLENSNWREQALCRVVFGKSCVNITSSLVHFLQTVIECLTDNDYPPYSTFQQHLTKSTLPAGVQITEDDIVVLEDFVPIRTYHLFIHHPIIKVNLGNHQRSSVFKRTKKDKKKHFSDEKQSGLPQCVPRVVITAGIIDLQLTKPMYPSRILAITSLISNPHQSLREHCYKHSSLKVFQLELVLEATTKLAKEIDIVVAPPCSFAVYFKELLHSEHEEHQLWHPAEGFLELDHFSIQMTKPQMLFLFCLIQSWFTTSCSLNLKILMIEQDVIDRERPLLSFDLSGLNWHFVETKDMLAYQGLLTCISIFLHIKNRKIALLQAPQFVSKICTAAYFRDSSPKVPFSVNLKEPHPFCQFTLQLPKNVETISGPVTVLLQMESIVMNADPAALLWLEFLPKENVSHYSYQESSSFSQADGTVRATGSAVSSLSSGQTSTCTQSQSLSTHHLQSQFSLGGTEVKSDKAVSFSEHFLKWYRILKCAIVQISIAPSCILCSTNSLKDSPLSEDSDLLTMWKNAYLTGKLSPCCIISLPNIKVTSHNNNWVISHNNFSTIPVQVPENISFSTVKFPWMLSMKDWSIYTLSSSDCSHILKPTNVSVSLAITESLPTTENSSLQMGLCIHLDIEPIHLSTSKEQVCIMATVADYILNCTDQILKTINWAVSQQRPNISILNESVVLDSDLSFKDVLVQTSEKEQSGDYVTAVGVGMNFGSLFCLTLWMQLTLPKLGLSVFKSASNGKDVWVQIEIEELSASLDIQDVFIKGKGKVTSFNISNFEKSSGDASWRTGCFDGIILCCTDKLTRNVIIPTSKTDRVPQKSFHDNSSQVSHSFLSLTFTRALASSAEQNWTKKLKDLPLAILVQESSCMNQHYIDEIDIQFSQFDVVLWMPLFASMIDVFYPLRKLLHNQMVQMPRPTLAKKKQPFGWNLITRNLPLMFVSLSAVRFFLPSDQPDEELQNQESLQDDCRREIMNVCVLQVDSVSILPQADNLLSRTIIDSKLFSAAQQMGTLHLPGSPVEDRQYQLDVIGLSMNSALWRDICHISVFGGPRNSVTILGQNPAADWNNRSSLTENLNEEDDASVFYPIAGPVDLRITAAPAIICNTNNEDKLVCGHSVEISALSDINIYLSFQQASLLLDIANNNFRQGLTELSENLKGIYGNISQQNIKGSEAVKDSGIESEISALQSGMIIEPDLSFISILSQSFHSSLSAQDEQQMKFVPADALLTARNIFISFYLHERDLKDRMKKSPCQKRKTHHRRSKSYSKSVQQDSQDPRSGQVSQSKTSPRLNRKHGKTALHREAASNESSPERTTMTSPHLRKRGVPKQEESEQGYEGSSDSSNAGKHHQDGILTVRRDIVRIHPFLHVSISEPHTFISCGLLLQKIEASCFDLQVRGGKNGFFVEGLGPAYFPMPSHYTQPWLESRPGDNDLKTGIPPPLYTVSIHDFLSWPAKSVIKFERPVLFHLSTSKLEQWDTFIQSAKEVLGKHLNLSSDGDNCNKESTSSISSDTSVPPKVCSWLMHLKETEFSTVHVAFAIEGSLPSGCEQLIAFSVSETRIIATVALDDEGKRIRCVNTSVEMQDALLKVNSSTLSRHFFGPYTACLNASFSWEEWFHSANPLVIARFSGETLFVTVGIKQLQILSQILGHWQQYFQSKELVSEDSNDLSSVKSSVSSGGKKKECTQIKTADDIRNGSFQFIHDWDGIGLFPKAGEVVFCKEAEASMTWRYPQPRILTTVDIYPVPIQPVDGNSEIQCSLQFWDTLKSNFVTYKQFQLVESSTHSLDLPPATLENVHTLVVCDTWRVTLTCLNAESEMNHLPVLPNVLAACMRVDSYFDSSFVATFQTSFSLGLVQTTFCNNFKTGVAPDFLYPFSFDALMPQDQEFMTITINGLSAIYKQWKTKQKIDVDFNICCELVEYRNLTMQLLMEPVDVQGQALVSIYSKNPMVIESGIYLHPCYVRVQQSSVHTLNLALQAWTQRETKQQLVPHYYLFCNNTQETLRFGQVNTDENIVLGKQQMHAYSWRSHRLKQTIRVCLESMQWKWSEPFSMDSEGVKVRIMENKGCRVTLVIYVKSINPLQKQIIISGQLLVSSRLDFPLDVRLLTQQSPPHWMEHRQSPTTLSQFSTAAAFLVSCSQPVTIQVRLQSVGLLWSDTVVVTGRDVKSKQLLQIPNRGGKQPLNVWCHIATQELLPNLTAYFVIFAPLFMVCNYLPRPLLAYVEVPDETAMTCLEVYGQGRDKQLHLTGDVACTRQLLFQMAAGMKTSSPAVTLPAVTCEELPPILKDCSTEDLLYNWFHRKPFCWPFNDLERQCEVEKLRNNALLQHNIPEQSQTVPLKLSEIPDTELQVIFSQQWPGFSTFMIDVKPWALFVNHSSIELYLIDASGKEWKICSGSVFTPPPLQDVDFSIAVEYEGELYESEALSFCAENVPPKCIVLYPDRKNHLPIYIRLGQNYKVCYLCADFLQNDGIVIVTFRPELFITNLTGRDFVLAGCTAKEDSTKITLKRQKTMAIPNSEKRQLQPLLFWDVLERQENGNRSFFLSFSHLDSPTVAWSHPLCLSLSSKEDQRFTVAVPEIEKTSYWCTTPYSLTVHKHQEIAYLVLNPETVPLIVLHNNTNFTLCYGQAVQQPLEGVTVEEELDLHGLLPTLPAGGTTFYSFPSLARTFPNMDQQPFIHFAKCEDSNATESMDFWSQPVDTTSEVDNFIHIPEAGDVRIHKEQLGHAMHIFVDSANRIEVSAKEIRSRIGTTSKSHSRSRSKSASVNPAPDLQQTQAMAISEKPGEQQPIKKEDMTTLCQPFVYATISLSHLCLIVCDDLSNSAEAATELLRLSLDDTFFICRTSSSNDGGSNLLRFSHVKQELTICISNVQLDNQMTADGGVEFDFQVVVIPQKLQSARRPFSGDLLSLASVNKSIENAAIVITLALESSYCAPVVNHKYFAVQKLSVALKPMSVYFEDAFYYKLMGIRSTFMPVAYERRLASLCQEVLLPRDIHLRALALSHPLHLTTFQIHSISLLFSLHASLKLYLAIDHSPLAFGPFEKSQLYTTSYKLGQLLTVHYITGALLRAGWVVGSLDLLGNPAGLARAVGSGISDLVLLPYKGMFQGPLYFIKGVSIGAASLMKQISSGAVTSVTNMAASISRNMDRLSLDREHLQRQEELRHNIPQGVTTGIVQGLSGFGISLLGAIAGLVDHPLQAVSSPSSTSSGASFVLTTAAGLVTGASKGIVGMMVKPIGGAAELISQTGQGFLRGVGWHTQPLQRYAPLTMQIMNHPNSQLKLMLKVLQQGLVGKELVMFLEASHTNQAGRHVGDILLLTTEVLSVVSKDDDRLQQTFALTEINCCKCPTDASVLYITIKPPTGTFMCEEDDPARERVADYVHRLSSAMGHEHSQPSPERSPLSIKWRDAYKFYVYSKLRDIFVAAFNIEQRKALGKRFFA